MLKRAYFMTVIDGVFCLVCYTRTSVVTLDWSEIMGAYNTADSVVRDRRSKLVLK